MILYRTATWHEKSYFRSQQKYAYEKFINKVQLVQAYSRYDFNVTQTGHARR